MKAKLLFDGKDLIVPEEMGTPKEDQLLGTLGERLAELAGRICYDSLGRGRSSSDFHRHIVEVGHGSVLEHYNVTVSIQDEFDEKEVLRSMLNRPGVSYINGRMTLNLRSILEWNNHGYSSTILARSVRNLGAYIAPQIIDTEQGLYCCLRPQEPSFESEKWISLYLSGSRGFSHEMVRHGDWTAISQRSTRYCDEGESPWIVHPLLESMLKDEGTMPSIEQLIEKARDLYCNIVSRLETYLRDRGADPLTARKQARGAARGYLGNALETEMIFSASVAQWKRILRQRGGMAADAEIKEIAILILGELKKSRYSSCFDSFKITGTGLERSIVEISDGSCS